MEKKLFTDHLENIKSTLEPNLSKYKIFMVVIIIPTMENIIEVRAMPE